LLLLMARHLQRFLLYFFGFCVVLFFAFSAAQLPGRSNNKTRPPRTADFEKQNSVWFCPYGLIGPHMRWGVYPEIWF